MRRNIKISEKPSVAQLEEEVKREHYKRRYRSVLRSTVFMLITVAAAAVLVATLFMPVLRIYGSSMTPTLDEGEIVICSKLGSYKTGDLVSFYIGNKLLVKRVIAGPGDWVNIDEDGTVYINDVAIDEPYIAEKSLGECDIELPYQVPESRLFLMGDHRSISIDSRTASVGCISDEQIVGKIVFRVWPFEKFGSLKTKY